jgi:hypothetical protein
MIGVIFKINSDWFVSHSFGQGQVKNYPLHPSSIQGAEEFAFEGEEVDFIVKGISAPRTLNGTTPSALIIYKKN